MSSQNFRVLVGQIFQETHGFSPVPTEMTAFEVDPPETLIAANEHADSTLGGMIRTFQAAGVGLVAAYAARARCGGKVTDRAYAQISEAIVGAAQAGGFDAIALDLHGCTQTASFDSAELDLLTRLRAVVGPDVPIVAGFDLHAHASAPMLAQLDFASAYKTNPHADAAATGARVANGLLQILREGARPTGFFVRLPMLTSGNDETGSGPLATLHHDAQRAVAAEASLFDYSIFNVNPFIDGPHVGQGLLAYGFGTAGEAAARTLATDLAHGLWAQRQNFVHRLPSIAQILQDHPRNARAITIGDFGDRVLAGAPGDSVHVLAEIQRLGGRHVTIIVTDPQAHAHCVEVGEGAATTLRLGATQTPGLQPLTISGVVKRIGDGSFTNRGQFMKGGVLRIGPYAVIEGADFVVLITQDAVMSQDPGCYLDAGVALDQADVIVVKSGYHFKLAFQDYGPCVIAQTPGLTGFEPRALPFTACRPIYPLDDGEPQIQAIRLAR